MRQEHRAAEKLLVDYAGQTLPVIDHHTGENQPMQMFVAVLGSSNNTFAEATRSQKLPVQPYAYADVSTVPVSRSVDLQHSCGVTPYE